MEIGGLIGLSFGIILALIGLLIERKKAKKRRELDEMHQYIWQKSRSIAWYATLLVLYILLVLALLGWIKSLIKALTILFIVHLFSLAITGSYLSLRYYVEEKADRQVQQIVLSLFSLFGVVLLVLTIFFL